MSLVLPVRWGARVLSALIVVFFGFFLMAHLIGDQGQPSRPLMWNDYVILTSIVISLAGLLLAWKWELAGAAITLIAIAVCAAVNLERSCISRRTHPTNRSSLFFLPLVPHLPSLIL